MIASLGMYDFGPARAANDRLWAGVRRALLAQGLDAPLHLTRGAAAYWPSWTAPDLLLSQTCGYPYRARLHGQVMLIAAPVFDLPDLPPGHYASVFVARADDRRARLEEFQAADFAWNEDLSQSGWAAAINHMASKGMTLKPAVETGSHHASAQSVANRRADLASLDIVSWTMLREGKDPAALALKVVETTAPTPALPFITAMGEKRVILFAALRQSIAELAPEDRKTLHLRDVTSLPPEAYLSVPSPPPPAHFKAKARD